MVLDNLPRRVKGSNTPRDALSNNRNSETVLGIYEYWFNVYINCTNQEPVIPLLDDYAYSSQCEISGQPGDSNPIYCDYKCGLTT